MKIYKFGGASLKSSSGVKVLYDIISKETDRLVVVISAMGKMTNALEQVVNSYFYSKPDLDSNIQYMVDYHNCIVSELFEDTAIINEKLHAIYDQLYSITQNSPSLSYDYEYDRVVSFGEILSTTIVECYLHSQGLNSQFVDVRTCIITDANHRDANVDMELSSIQAQKLFSEDKIYVTQGFIAGTITNHTTTLGREGSDYSAAILAYLLNADSLTIWKDVPGVMNADPKLYDDVEIIPVLSYKEAIELSYCGASVIHPKTVKPLQNKAIPLHVRSFVDTSEIGSVIGEIDYRLDLPPIYINKQNQVLLTLTPRDFSFIAEERLSQIFSVLATYKLKSSLVQTSAISFSLCVDYNEISFGQMINDLKGEYEVLYNTDVELITVRHYTREIVDQLIGERIVFVEQRNRLTARFVVSHK